MMTALRSSSTTKNGSRPPRSSRTSSSETTTKLRVGEDVRVLSLRQRGRRRDGSWDASRPDRYEERVVVVVVRVLTHALRYPDGSWWFSGETRDGVRVWFCTRSIVVA